MGGVVTQLASSNFAIALNRPYRLRLESIGTRHRVYMNGVSVLDVDDTALKSGRAALLTHRCVGRVRQRGRESDARRHPVCRGLHDHRRPDGSLDVHGHRAVATALRSARTSCSRKARWRYTARAVIGVPTDDQTVDVRARPTTFAGTGTGDRWFGVMARYVDDSNYYYLTLRSSESGVAAQGRQRRHHRARHLFTADHARHLVPTAASRRWDRRFAASSTACWSPKPPMPRIAAARPASSPIAPPRISTTITPSSPEPRKGDIR